MLLHIIAALFHALNAILGHFSKLLKFDRGANIWKDWQDESLTPPPRSLDGSPAHSLMPFRTTDGAGTYITALMFFEFDRAVVSKWLPSTMELGDSAETTSGKHPALLTFGYQQKVLPLFMEGSKIRGMDYSELVIAIPDTRLKDAKGGYAGPFTYMPRLHLNALLPTILGWFFGYPKHLSRIAGGSSDFTVNSLFDGSPIISGSFETFGSSAPPAKFPQFERINRYFHQPLAGVPILGLQLYSYYQWQFESALLQETKARITVSASDLPVLPKGEYLSGEGALLYCCRQRVPWDLAGPCLRGEIRS